MNVTVVWTIIMFAVLIVMATGNSMKLLLYGIFLTSIVMIPYKLFFEKKHGKYRSGNMHRRDRW